MHVNLLRKTNAGSELRSRPGTGFLSHYDEGTAARLGYRAIRGDQRKRLMGTAGGPSARGPQQAPQLRLLGWMWPSSGRVGPSTLDRPSHRHVTHVLAHRTCTSVNHLSEARNWCASSLRVPLAGPRNVRSLTDHPREQAVESHHLPAIANTCMASMTNDCIESMTSMIKFVRQNSNLCS
jgi:hypothetical protein